MGRVFGIAIMVGMLLAPTASVAWDWHGTGWYLVLHKQGEPASLFDRPFATKDACMDDRTQSWWRISGRLFTLSASTTQPIRTVRDISARI
jgi:hypothetical protein